MNRRHVSFPCDAETLFGTLDHATGAVGLLIVSGGNEIRSGAFAGMAQLAEDLAVNGYPVFRFDRRGVGDSSGENGGFRTSAADIAAALTELRRLCPEMRRVVAFGNCDAASALMLASGAGCDGLVLANPWTFDDDMHDAMPAEALRSRYAAKLTNPREWLRLLRGGVNLRKLAAGLRTALGPAPAPTGLFAEMRAGMREFSGDTRFLIAGRDRTGIAFRSAWRDAPDLTCIADADHAFSSSDARADLLDALVSSLHEQARQLDMV